MIFITCRTGDKTNMFENRKDLISTSSMGGKKTTTD